MCVCAQISVLEKAVDEGIAPLVLALGELDGVLVVASSQGGPDRPAYVRFRAREDDERALANQLSHLLGSGGSGAELRTLARPGAGGVGGRLLELVCAPGLVLSLALAVREMARHRVHGAGTDGDGHPLSWRSRDAAAGRVLVFARRGLRGNARIVSAPVR